MKTVEFVFSEAERRWGTGMKSTKQIRAVSHLTRRIDNIVHSQTSFRTADT